MKSRMAIVLFCGVLPAWCQSVAPDVDDNPAPGRPRLRNTFR